MSERVIVRPGDGQPLADLLSALIAVADHPHDVRWEHRGGVVTVPEHVAARYAASVSDTDSEPDTATEPLAAQPAAEQPAKRKPGRPKKATSTGEVN